MNKALILVAAGAITLLGSGCAAHHSSGRPLACGVVECRSASCRTPHRVEGYDSSRWRCVDFPRTMIW